MHRTGRDPLREAPPHDSPVSAAPADDESEELRSAVARAIRKVCPQWLADQADDLTQIATMRVLDRVRAGVNRAELSAGYSYRAAYSALVDEIRRRRRLREVPIDPTLLVRPAGIDPERQARSHEIRETIQRCLAGIAASRRRAVMLHLLGHSIDEACGILNFERKRIENLMYRGLADLRACLTAHGVTP